MDNQSEAAKKIIQQLGGLEEKRRPLENLWQKIYELVDPANAFITREYSAQEILKDDLYSTTALRALPKFVAAMQSTVTPPNEQWHRLIPPTRKLKENSKAVAYLENCTDDLFEMRYRPAGGFNKAIIKNWYSLAKIGLGCMFVDEAKDGGGSMYFAVNMKDFYPVLYSTGQIKKCFHKMKKDYWELCEELEDKGINPAAVIPDNIRERGEKNPNEKLRIVHYVEKLSDREVKENAIEFKAADGTVIKIKRKYRFYLTLNEGNKPVVLDTGFFFTCPYMFVRYQELDYDIHSNSPSIQGSSDISMLQRIRKSIIETAEKAVDPTILAKNDAELGGVQPVAGAMIVGGLDEQGKPNLQALNISGSAALGVDLEELITKGIEDFYLVPLYMMYYNDGTMTATEVNQRAMERAMLMSINAFPVENELLSPMAARELDIMTRCGKLPEDMPKELQKFVDNDQPFYAIQYEGEQHKAQELIKANGLMTTFQAMATLSQFDPAISQAPKPYRCLQTLARANGAPIDHFKDESEYEQAVEAYQAAQQAAAAVDLKTAETAANAADRYSTQLAQMRY